MLFVVSSIMPADRTRIYPNKLSPENGPIAVCRPACLRVDIFSSSSKKLFLNTEQFKVIDETESSVPHLDRVIRLISCISVTCYGDFCHQHRSAFNSKTSHSDHSLFCRDASCYKNSDRQLTYTRRERKEYYIGQNMEQNAYYFPTF